MWLITWFHWAKWMLLAWLPKKAIFQTAIAQQKRIAIFCNRKFYMRLYGASIIKDPVSSLGSNSFYSKSIRVHFVLFEMANFRAKWKKSRRWFYSGVWRVLWIETREIVWRWIFWSDDDISSFVDKSSFIFLFVNSFFSKIPKIPNVCPFNLKESYVCIKGKHFSYVRFWWRKNVENVNE